MNAAALSRLFSSAVLGELTRFGRSALFARLVTQAGFHGERFDRLETVADVYDAAYALLCRGKSRDDYVYRAAIATKVVLGRHSLNTSVMLNEFRIGGSKADAIVLNGTSTAYEFKSERDSLARLPAQLNNYAKCVDQIYVVTGRSHLRSVQQLAPATVGILVLSDRMTLQTEREAVSMVDSISPVELSRSLTVGECVRVLGRCRIDVPDLPNTKTRGFIEDAFEVLDPRDVHAKVLDVVKEARSQAHLKEGLSRLPASLRPAVLSGRLGVDRRSKIDSALSATTEQAMGWV